MHLSHIQAHPHRNLQGGIISLRSASCNLNDDGDNDEQHGYLLPLDDEYRPEQVGVVVWQTAIKRDIN
ncbi:hypothetical protein PHLCEN_2v6658 [Hermanssonia centrifuga]|uniref:Uncharacterized protein n=1 Tax=Hermanssonia centrifuga TaxID=98765 RepID=A0A2R6NYY4_9APHY|nr:hypothetical protein PHLCEN_2v6658 [Hermanssonia centrifuga]